MKKKLILTALAFGTGTMMLSGAAHAAAVEDVLEKYTEASKNVTSFHADCDMNLAVGLGITMSDINMTMDVALLGDLLMDYVKDPLAVKLDGSMSLTVPGEAEETISMQLYTVTGETGDLECYVYMNDGTEGEWEYSSLPADQFTQLMDMANTMQADYSQLPGTVTLAPDMVEVNGISCYEITDVITWADLAPLITQAMESTPEIDEDDLEEIQATLDMAEMALEGIQMNMIIDINAETYCPVKARIDFNGSDLSTLCQMLALAFSDTDEEGNAVFPEISLDISNLFLEMNYDYTTQADFTIPQEALAEKADSDGENTLGELAEEVLDEVA